MALPGSSGNRMSATPHTAAFVGARESLNISDTQDYETGGVAFLDTSQGLMSTDWGCRIESNTVIATPDGGSDLLIHTPVGTVTECSMTFMTDMSIFLAYVEDGVAYYKRLYTETTPGIADEHNVPGSAVATGAFHPRATLDDKRPDAPDPRVVVAYTREFGGIKHLYVKQTGTGTNPALTTGEHIGALAPELDKIWKIGMNQVYRVQFAFVGDI